MALDWRDAFLRQAKADYDLLLKLQHDNDVPLCHKLHLLQMATEKLAKGWLTKPGGSRYALTHEAFVNFVSVANFNPEIKHACGIKSQNSYNAYIKSLHAAAQEIEDLVPKGDARPNPEYPWEHAGLIVSPLDYAFTNLNLGTLPMIKMLQFLRNVFELV